MVSTHLVRGSIPNVSLCNEAPILPSCPDTLVLGNDAMEGGRPLAGKGGQTQA